MKHITKNEEVYLYSMGKRLKITSMFTSVDECNKHCEASNDAVIAEFGPFIFCADKGDQGLKTQ